ncbi:MAG: hypothetical protein ACREO8_05555 [Luteimonas sp.]
MPDVAVTILILFPVYLLGSLSGSLLFGRLRGVSTHRARLLRLLHGEESRFEHARLPQRLWCRAR